MVLIEYSAYPYLIDLILEHADPKIRLAFSATCRRERRRVTHVAMHLESAAELNCAAPRFVFTTPSCTQRALHRPDIVRVLDLGGVNAGFAVHRCMARHQREAFSRLTTIRRTPPSRPWGANPRSNHVRIKDVHTVVDYLDLRDVSGKWGRLNLLSCHEHHVFHVRWDASSTASLPHYDLHNTNRHGLKFTLVLWPQPELDSPVTGAATPSSDEIGKFIQYMYRKATGPGTTLTIVAPTSDFVQVQFWPKPIPTDYLSHEAWFATLGPDEDVLATWIPWRKVALSEV